MSLYDSTLIGRYLHSRKSEGLRPPGLTPPASDRKCCPEHDRETLDYYCLEDNCEVCAYCLLVGNHTNHSHVAIEAIADGVLSKICSELVTLEETKRTLCYALSEWEAKAVPITTSLEYRASELISSLRQLDETRRGVQATSSHELHQIRHHLKLLLRRYQDHLRLISTAATTTSSGAAAGYSEGRMSSLVAASGSRSGRAEFAAVQAVLESHILTLQQALQKSKDQKQGLPLPQQQLPPPYCCHTSSRSDLVRNCLLHQATPYCSYVPGTLRCPHPVPPQPARNGVADGVVAYGGCGGATPSSTTGVYEASAQRRRLWDLVEASRGGAAGSSSSSPVEWYTKLRPAVADALALGDAALARELLRCVQGVLQRDPQIEADQELVRLLCCHF